MMHMQNQIFTENKCICKQENIKEDNKIISKIFICEPCKKFMDYNLLPVPIPKFLREK